MNLKLAVFFVVSITSCQQIENASSLSTEVLNHIRSLHLLDPDEKLQLFYSEYKKKSAGNFFTNKRIAKYWIDDRDSNKNEINWAYYSEILSIDTVYYAGLTYSPYMLVTKKDSTKFKVCADGTREEIKSFFEQAINLWHINATSK